MAIPIIQNAFVTGEIAPSLYGRTDLDKTHAAANTMRNLFVSYRGGAYSRGGTAFCGYSKQTGTGVKPRLITFQFDINQGLALEFGDEYMRVIANGAYVTENALPIYYITNENPAYVVTFGSAAETATPSNTAVASSYAPGDYITLAGGSYTVPAELQVVNTTLLGIQGYGGAGYKAGDTINLAGGVQTSGAVATVATTKVLALPTIVNAGSGGTPGVATVTGTTGTGTKFQASVTITGSQAASPNNGAVTSSYAAGDTITLAGGTYTSPAVLKVTYTILESLSVVSSGTHYAPGDTITLGGGTTTLNPVATVATTKVVGTPTIAAGGTGGTNGTATVTGTTGAGTKFQASVTISGGAITAVNSVTVAGSYTANPSNLAAEPVTGGGLTGAQLSLVMGVNTITFSAGGQFTVNPSGGTLTQIATSGSGTAATFTGIFAPGAVTFQSSGSYTVFPSNPVAQGATSGTGYGVTFTVSNSSSISAVNSVTVAGAYTLNPTTPSAEPVTGGGLTGAILGLQMSIGTLTISSGGTFTSNPAGGVMTQSATSGAGTGATFGSALLGPETLNVVTAGVYTTFPSNPVAQGSTTGGGAGATFDLTSGSTTVYNDGDWVYLTGIVGMTELNGRTFVASNANSSGFYLNDVFGNPIDSTSFPAYSGGGTAARIYTLTTPWAAGDLPYLKFTQSADVMSICCVNQLTATEYPPYDLTRLADNNWTLQEAEFGAQIATPTNVVLTRTNDDGGSQVYVTYYAVTAVNNVTGEESAPTIEIEIGNEALGTDNGSGDVPSNTITWAPVAGASYYNVYKETPLPLPSGYPLQPPPPSFIMGYIGQTQATCFTDAGLQPDFSQTPPQHQNPFARGAIIASNVTNGGSGYYFAATTPSTVDTSTGSGAVILAANVSPSAVIGSMVILNGGENYAPGDTITVVGNGSGATATLTIGPASGTYPGAVSYFQERRVYAATLNNPDTYWMSKAELYLNFDTSFPSVASDAITGSPWGVQVNGIQWMLNMPGGLVVLTGLSAWQLTGAGGSSLNPQPITPADEQAQPQAYNGCSATVPPIKIDDSIIYVQAKGSIYRQFTYQYFQNIYTGVDLTELSSHLFTGFTILENAYCEEPYKIIWAVRDDGVMLSLTYLKNEQVTGWARHDTNGAFVSCCSVTEPPVDALYVATQRTINGQTAYFVERMDNRIWSAVEDTWCVDCGLSIAQPTPNATLTASSPYGSGMITGVTNLVGGTGYSAGTTVLIVDNNGTGPGSGATASIDGTDGVITSVVITSPGANYINPQISFIDPANTGSGASCMAILTNAAIFTADSSVFSPESVGQIIRMGGGIAEITVYISAAQVAANILVPIAETYPNSGIPGVSWPNVVPQQAGSWTLSTPTTTAGGLWHLVGATVTGLADGNVIPPQVVAANGTITLETAASAITVGLGFTAQLQSPYFDAGEKMLSQGRRKSIPAVTARVELSRGLQIGVNQPDGAALSPPQIAPYWWGMQNAPDRRPAPYNGLAKPLYTGDVRIPVLGQYDTRGQVAMQQTNPLPMTVLAFIPEIQEGDLEAGKSGTQPAGGPPNLLDAGYSGGSPASAPPTTFTPGFAAISVPSIYYGAGSMVTIVLDGPPSLTDTLAVEFGYANYTDTPPEVNTWYQVSTSGETTDGINTYRKIINVWNEQDNYGFQAGDTIAYVARFTEFPDISIVSQEAILINTISVSGYEGPYWIFNPNSIGTGGAEVTEPFVMGLSDTPTEFPSISVGLVDTQDSRELIYLLTEGTTTTTFITGMTFTGEILSSAVVDEPMSIMSQTTLCSITPASGATLVAHIIEYPGTSLASTLSIPMFLSN
jgi:hypothetical protein